MIPTDRFLELAQLLEISARPFLSAVAAVRDIRFVVSNIPIEEQDKFLGADDVMIIEQHLQGMIDAINAISARSALRSAERLQSAIEGPSPTLSYVELNAALEDIESRFADHLEDIKMFVVSDEKAKYLDDDIMPMEIWVHFPSATFEVEESAKCIALGRHTASVFHCMRVLEIGIRAFARSLKIDDPVKPADRNWGVMLKKLKDSIDALRVNNRKKAEMLDGIYATLDAVRGPWRNATMHVDNVYAPHDAVHIYNCTEYFMKSLAQHCDEDGHGPL